MPLRVLADGSAPFCACYPGLRFCAAGSRADMTFSARQRGCTRLRRRGQPALGFKRANRSGSHRFFFCYHRRRAFFALLVLPA